MYIIIYMALGHGQSCHDQLHHCRFVMLGTVNTIVTTEAHILYLHMYMYITCNVKVALE